MSDFYSVASDALLGEDNLVVDGDWLSEEEKAGVKIVTDQEWDEMARNLAEVLEMTANDWISENVRTP